MKMIPVYNANGDKILACACDLGYYQTIGWTPEEPAKAPAKAKSKSTKEAE